jgi:hypothetical protein
MDMAWCVKYNERICWKQIFIKIWNLESGIWNLEFGISLIVSS